MSAEPNTEQAAEASAPPTQEQLLADMTKLGSQFREAMTKAQGLEEQLTEKQATITAHEATITAKDEEIAQLKAAQDEPAELQKVAYDESKLGKTLDVLIERDLITAEDREKLASKLLENPNAALNVITQVATLRNNLPVADTGVGIPKEASAKKAASNVESGGFGSMDAWLEA